MVILLLLFIAQTLLLSLSYSLSPLPIVKLFPADLLQKIVNWKVAGLHQPINIAFLVGMYYWKSDNFSHMLYYFRSRRFLGNYLLIAFYLATLLLYLEIIGSKFLYKNWLYPFVASLLILFPFFFPKQAIKNPIGIQANDYNFMLLGEKGQKLPISYPQTGIYIMGLPGCGKTTCLVEPILYQMIRKGYSGIVYDYDISNHPFKNAYSLTQVAYQTLQICNKKLTSRQFFSINFQDLNKASRINPINPDYIQDRKKLSHCLYTLLLNLNPSLVQRDDFWYQNSYALIKSVMVFLSNQYPSYCTLPHTILLGLQDPTKLLPILEKDKEAALYASPVLDAFRHSGEQFAGVIANMKVLLERLLDKDIFWVLSGDEVPLTINDPTNPLIVCLGNTPKEKNYLSPIIAMILAVLAGNMYGHDRHKSFILMDELPTLLLPGLSEIPATGRKYHMAAVVALQNIAQLERTYGNVGAREIRETFSNHLMGRGPYSSSKEISDMMGKELVEATSTTRNQRDVSKTFHQKEERLTKPEEGMKLQVGEFMGHVVHPDGGFFKMRLRPLSAYDRRLKQGSFPSLPVVDQNVDVLDNFNRIKKEVEEIMKV